MGELLQQNQEMSIVPQNFKNSTKGVIKKVYDKGFDIEVIGGEEDFLPKKTLEFYSPTKNGMLYFTSSIMEKNGKMFSVMRPLKHRFLQRRSFSRIKFVEDLEFKANENTYKVTSVDLAAGGMKLRTSDYLDLNLAYDVNLVLGKIEFQLKFVPIRIEKNDGGNYTVSGRFENLSKVDTIKLMQFCMKKNVDNLNK